MLLHLMPLVFVVLVQFAGALADPLMRNLPDLDYRVPARAHDEAGVATTYGRVGVDPDTGEQRDSDHQALMACAPEVRVGPTMAVCAHRTHRCGTVLLLEHVATRRATLCRVMDRGPYGCYDPGTVDEEGEPIALNLAILRKRGDPRAATCVPRGFLDMGPAVRADLAAGDGGRQRVRAWVVDVPPRPIRVRPRRRVGPTS